MSFQHLLHHIAHEYRGGVATLAQHMRKVEGTLRNKLNPNNKDNGINAEEIEEMLDLSDDGNAQTARYFADKANMLVIPMIDFHGSDMELLDGTAELMKEIGDFFDVFRKAYADGRIDLKEWKRIQKEGIDVQAKMATLMNRIGQMVEDKPVLKAVR